MLRITIAQLNFTVGDIEGNVARMVDAARQAAAEQSNLVVFSELALCGYYPGDMLDEPEFIARVEAGIAALQARIRGTVLMEYSNAFGHLLLTTGNKSEISVGYCTLYGDTNGGLGLLGDLYKTEVFALSRHVNEHAGRELISQAIIDKEPSAELAPGQRDVDSLPPYPVLDEVLKLLIEGDRVAFATFEFRVEFVRMDGSE